MTSPTEFSGLDCLSAGAMVLDADDRIRYLNPAAETLLGVSGALLVGEAAAQAFERSTELLRAIRTARSEQETVIEYELDVAVSGDSTVREADKISSEIEHQLLTHIPALSTAHVRVRPAGAALHAGHHHAPDPVAVKGELGEGVIEIIETPAGERLRFRAQRLAAATKVSVEIERPGGRVETLSLTPLAEDPSRLVSADPPAEPHEFDARLCLQASERREALAFRMVEPVEHTH